MVDIHNDIVVWLSIITLRKGNCERRNAGMRNGSNVVHTGNYTEMMQKSRSTVASQQLYTAQPSSVGPAAYP